MIGLPTLSKRLPSIQQRNQECTKARLVSRHWWRHPRDKLCIIIRYHHLQDITSSSKWSFKSPQILSFAKRWKHTSPRWKSAKMPPFKPWWPKSVTKTKKESAKCKVCWDKSKSWTKSFFKCNKWINRRTNLRRRAFSRWSMSRCKSTSMTSENRSVRRLIDYRSYRQRLGLSLKSRNRQRGLSWTRVIWRKRIRRVMRLMTILMICPQDCRRRVKSTLLHW